MKAPQAAEGAPGAEGASGSENGAYGATSADDARAAARADARAEARRREHAAVPPRDALEATLRAKRGRARDPAGGTTSTPADTPPKASSHANPDVRAHTRDAGAEHASAATPAAPAPGAGASEAPVCLCEAFCCGSAGEPRAKRATPQSDARARKPRTSLERAAALVRSRYLDSLLATIRREHAGSVTLERARRLKRLRLAEESLLRIARKGMR